VRSPPNIVVDTSLAKPISMARIRVKKARELGSCFGVRRAIKIIDKAAGENTGISTLGPIVHNRLVVDKLNKAGVKVVDDLNLIEGGVIAIASHGAPPQVLSQIQERKFQVIDTTCPIVRSAQKAAKELADAGFHVIIFGEASHPEVKGLLGWAGSNAVATMDGAGLAATELSQRLGIIAQTTQSQSSFVEFCKDVINAVFPAVQEVRIINTLCQETQKRQQAAVELAGKSDLMIVVGGHNSANTQRLEEVCGPLVETHLIETATEIKKEWLKGKQRIGVTAGASTPDEAIEKVVLKLESLAGDV
jgi:4-hydroxy-3-methylbut-2-enyl diphosphate reductase